MKSILFSLLGSFAFLCAPAHGDDSGERKAVIDMMLQWEAAVETGDFQKLEQYYAEDAVYYPNRTEPVIGRERILQRNRQRGSGSRVDIVQEADDIRINGDWAVYSCRATVRVTRPPETEASERQVRVLLLLQKSLEGQWQILRDIDNEPPTVASP